MEKMNSFLVKLILFLAFILASSNNVNGQEKNPAWLGNVYHILFNNKDCNGDENGSAYFDNCKICVGGNTNELACAQDCNGDWGGTAITNSCGCVAGNTGIDENVTCVTNAITNKVWMDRNLGASRVAISLTDSLAYGDLYQWGRLTDGHEKRDSGIRNIQSDVDNPGHGDFIYGFLDDWRNSPNDLLWQGSEGVNNPCPSGFRLPTKNEFQDEISSWAILNSADEFPSALKLTLGGYRSPVDGSIPGFYLGFIGYYYASDINGTYVYGMKYLGKSAKLSDAFPRSVGNSIRCILD